MKKFIAVCLLILNYSCLSSDTSRVNPIIYESFEIYREDLHIGEYLQVDSEGRLITVVRDKGSDVRGLVRIDMRRSQEIEPLDPQAIDAKDIHYRNSRIIYRRDKDLNFFQAGRSHSLSEQVNRVFNFHWSSAGGRADVETASGLYVSLCFDENADVISETTSPGRIIRSVLADHVEWILYQNSQGIGLLKNLDCNAQSTNTILLEESIESEFGSLLIHEKKLYAYYLDKKTGQLRVTIVDLETETRLSTEVVDGIAFENYVGMDQAAFWDPVLNAPAIIYLDAWRLRLRLARRHPDGWRSEEIALAGAVGFYTQVLEVNANHILFAFHSFRNQRPDRTSSFENLNILRIELR